MTFRCEATQRHYSFVPLSVASGALQARFNHPLWATVDELAMYLEEVFDACKDMRAHIPMRNLSAANRDLVVYTAVMITFTGLCGIL